MDNSYTPDPSDQALLPPNDNFSVPQPQSPQTPLPPPPTTSFDSPPVPPIAPMPQNSSLETTAPLAVVRVLSPRGVEYVFMTIALFVGVGGLISALISFVNGKFDFGVLEFPTAVLLVSVPTFAWLFLRLKKAELANPSLRLEPSKRRSTQFIQITNFIICFFTLIGIIVGIFAKMSGQYNGSGGSLFKLILDGLIIILVLGSILAYYWRDERRGAQISK